MTFEILPAVDVRAGQAVQLVRGVDGTQKVFGDPLAAARRWQADGARWLHLVDLDAAFGRAPNADVVAAIVAEVDVDVELTGGIRDDETLERALATGCRRVNIGTAALERPQWCARAIAAHGERVAIALDVRGAKLATRGWTQDAGDLDETLDRLDEAGCARYVVTDIGSDGVMAGPNLELLRHVCARTDAPVVASGGVSTLADVRALRELAGEGVEGAIVGTALYVGAFTLADALRVAAGSQGG